LLLGTVAFTYAKNTIIPNNLATVFDSYGVSTDDFLTDLLHDFETKDYTEWAVKENSNTEILVDALFTPVNETANNSTTLIREQALYPIYNSQKTISTIYENVQSSLGATIAKMNVRNKRFIKSKLSNWISYCEQYNTESGKRFKRDYEKQYTNSKQSLSIDAQLQYWTIERVESKQMTIEEITYWLHRIDSEIVNQ